MSEAPDHGPEVAIESQEITREDAEQIVSDIERATKGVGDFWGKETFVRVEPSTEGEQGYFFRVNTTYADKGTRREKDDSTDAHMEIFRITPGGYGVVTYPSLALNTSRFAEEGGLAAQLYLHDWDNSSNSEEFSLVGEVRCDKNGCRSTEGKLVQAKVNDLIVSVLQPKLAKLEVEREAQTAEETRLRDEARRVEETRKAEEAASNDPVNKTREF